ncbi:hypothetical protein Scep_008729 [Stephania cephalantha]|uniref:Protein CHUP1, chloroplastic n=1 Tax=Stephania cephalantha TaxID=152367 RepID=A0AAP0JRQ7_9MAGN
MKQEIVGSKTSENKGSSFSSQSTTPSRVRGASPRVKQSPRSEVNDGVSAGLKARPRSVPPDPTISQKVRRSIGLTKPKSGEDIVGPQKGREVEEMKVVGRTGNRPAVVEQCARLRRRPDLNCQGNEDYPDGEKKELKEKLDASENLVKDLQAEVLVLNGQLQKLQSLNFELELQNRQLREDVAASEEKISALSSSRRQVKEDAVAGKFESSNFKDIQKLMAGKLENLGAKKDYVKDRGSVQLPAVGVPNLPFKVEEKQPKSTANAAPPPPPPPPPLPRGPVRVAAAKRAPTIVEFYHTLTKQEVKKNALAPSLHCNNVAGGAHSSIVGEIQNRSSHLLAIRKDVETKGDLIRSLIEKIRAAVFTDIEDVLNFVDWIDNELSSLADERAVLKNFNWPERKADAMREAAIEYRDLKRLASEVSSYMDDSNTTCEASLKKIAGLLDKSEKSIQRLVKMRDSAIPSYRECKIPFDWMLDSGMATKIKQASMRLAKLYMKRVSMELESSRSSERESTQEALLLQGVRFAYRTHQFAGGLDSETMCAFEDIRRRVPVHIGGARELLTGIASW